MEAVRSNNDPILIVGAGPTGLAMAVDLARRQVPFRIIDVSREATDKSKAIGIQARTLEHFQNIGIADQFTATGKKCIAANVFHDRKVLVRLPFKTLDSPFPYLLMVPQSDTERILVSHLESLGGKIDREVKLSSFFQDSNGVEATLTHRDGSVEEIRTPWLIGCDGAHSTVRHGLALPFEGEEYEEGFQLADVRIDWGNRDDELYVYVHDGWILAAFALPEGHWRLIADVPPDSAPKDKSPSLEEWQRLVNERCPVPAKLSDPRWTANYRIQRRLVSQLRLGHVFLVGDAAHIHSPAGAQGMNTGIQDALNLSWKLALIRGGLAGEGLLDSYQNERYPVEKSVLAETNVPLEMFGLTNPLATSIRDNVISFFSSFGAVRKSVRESISEIAIKYSASDLIEDHSLGAGPKAGERAPDAAIATNEYGLDTVFDCLKGTEHKVLLFGRGDKYDDYADDMGSLVQLVRRRFEGKVRVYHFSANGEPIEQIRADASLPDADGKILSRYGSKHGAVYLIRPDGYIGFRSSLDTAEERLRSYLDTAFPSMQLTT